MQTSLFHESVYDALGSVVSALGGAKVVAMQLWPEKDPVDAGKLLRHCLNPDRPEKLSIEQVIWLMKAGRQDNCHDIATYLLRDCGYQDPIPIEPDDERAALMREFVLATERMEKLSKQMQRVGLVKVA